MDVAPSLLKSFLIELSFITWRPLENDGRHRIVGETLIFRPAGIDREHRVIRSSGGHPWIDIDPEARLRFLAITPLRNGQHDIVDLWRATIGRHTANLREIVRSRVSIQLFPRKSRDLIFDRPCIFISTMRENVLDLFFQILQRISDSLPPGATDHITVDRSLDTAGDTAITYIEIGRKSKPGITCLELIGFLLGIELKIRIGQYPYPIIHRADEGEIRRIFNSGVLEKPA